MLENVIKVAELLISQKFFKLHTYAHAVIQHVIYYFTIPVLMKSLGLNTFTRSSEIKV